MQIQLRERLFAINLHSLTGVIDKCGNRESAAAPYLLNAMPFYLLNAPAMPAKDCHSKDRTVTVKYRTLNMYICQLRNANRARLDSCLPYKQLAPTASHVSACHDLKPSLMKP